MKIIYMKGIHPTTIAESFNRAAQKATEYLNDMSMKLDLNDRESLLKSATTSLNSKVSFTSISGNAGLVMWISANNDCLGQVDRLSILQLAVTYRRRCRPPCY
jgi:hypothetical protein